MSETGAPPGTGRRDARESQRRRRRVRARRTWLSVLLGVGILLVASALAWTAIRPLVASLTEANDYPGPGAGQVSVTIPDGATGTEIAQVLKDAGVVKSIDAFVTTASGDSRASGIQPGDYLLRREMSAAGALDVLADPANRQVARVTIREGLRADAILQTVAEETAISAEDLAAAADAPGELGLPAEADGDLEGWLFPATYEVSGSTTATALLSRMVARTVQELTDLGVQRASWQRTIIAASLVEAERSSDEDAPKVARVVQNRLERDMPLQMDSTINYALDRYKIGVSIEDTKIDSPYNTYQRKGLPVGPICSPGAASIKAVLAPADGDWLYFVTVNPDTGETKFATTEAEFFEIKAELDAWLAANPGR